MEFHAWVLYQIHTTLVVTNKRLPKSYENHRTISKQIVIIRYDKIKIQ